MTHHHYEEWMSLALDGRLSAQEHAALESHLAACDECRARWAAFQQVDHLLTRAAQVSPAPGFSARVAARLAHEQAHRRARAPQMPVEWRIIAGIGAVSAGVMAIVLLVVPALVAAWYGIGGLMESGPSILGSGVELAARLLVTLQAFGEAGRSTAAIFARSGGRLLLGYLLVLLLVTATWLAVIRGAFRRWTINLSVLFSL